MAGPSGGGKLTSITGTPLVGDTTVYGAVPAGATATFKKNGTVLGAATVTAQGAASYTLGSALVAGDQVSFPWTLLGESPAAVVAAQAGLTAPVLTWTSGTAARNPTMSVTLAPTPTVGDVVTVQVSTASDFSTIYGTGTATLSSADVANGTCTPTGFPTLALGTTYYARAKFARGGVDSPWSATVTKVMDAVDTTPDQFSFTDVTGATLSTVYTSNTVTPTGFNSPVTASVTGGTISINGGAFGSGGTFNPGDTIAARVTTPATNSTASNVVVTIGGVSDTYTVVTVAASGGGAAVAWVPKTGFTITNSSLTIAKTGGAYNLNDRADTALTGKKVWKTVVDAANGNTDGTNIGVIASTASEGTINPGAGIGLNGSTLIYSQVNKNGAYAADAPSKTGSTAVGDAIYHLFDATNRKYAMKIGANGTWSGNYNPADGSGGTTVDAGTYYPGFFMGGTGAQITATFADDGSGAAPAGFTWMA